MRVGYDISLSERSKELLTDGTLTEIMNQIEKDLEGEWKHSSDLEARERVWHELHALHRVNLKLQAMVGELLLQEGRY